MPPYRALVPCTPTMHTMHPYRALAPRPPRTPAGARLHPNPNPNQVLGCTRSVWEAVHTWKIQPKGARPGGRGAWAAGEWVRAVEAYDGAQVRELQLLFHSFLAALITYFDCVRAGRARHTVGEPGPYPYP